MLVLLYQQDVYELECCSSSFLFSEKNENDDLKFQRFVDSTANFYLIGKVTDHVEMAKEEKRNQ